MPPSLNSIWRHGRNPRTGKPVVYLDKQYKAWKLAADALLMTQKPKEVVHGSYELTIILDETRRGRRDADNYAKCVSDFLARVGLIDNDKFCDSISVRWGKTSEHGCDVILFPATEQVGGI